MRTNKQKHKARAKTEEARSVRRAAKARPTAEISFANEKARDYFLSWLCGSGEQHYWDWQEAREEEEDGPITATSFDYHAPNGGNFGPKVHASCGRIDDGTRTT